MASERGNPMTAAKEGEVMDTRFKLCYVDGHKAYFTTQELQTQWGDDWNDAPYEHNAGTPYSWREGSNVPPYEIGVCFWDGDLETPSSGYLNSHYSVEMINAGMAPWLRSSLYGSGESVEILAGVTFPEFVRLVDRAGGKVFVSIPKDALAEEGAK